jgi:hypothetical protein
MASIGAKADYVRAKIREGRAGNHHCHWPGCERLVPSAPVLLASPLVQAANGAPEQDLARLPHRPGGQQNSQP